MAQEIADSKLIDTWASSGLIVEPDISKIIEGWQLGEQPPHEYMNWLQNTFGSKLNHILKNGVASWNNETEYLAGSSVQHNGNVWLCKTTNTNSEPSDVNANWKRIITVESLTTVLGGYVALTQFTGTNQSLATNGYQKIPGGLIIQWGKITDADADLNGRTYGFPLAFPNAPLSFSAVAILENDTYASTGGVYLTSVLSTAQFRIASSNGSSGRGWVYWIAIGY